LLIKIFISVYFELPNTWLYSIKETVSYTKKNQFFPFSLIFTVSYYTSPVKIAVQSHNYHFVQKISYIVQKSCQKKLENFFWFRLSYWKKKLENTTTVVTSKIFVQENDCKFGLSQFSLLFFFRSSHHQELLRYNDRIDFKCKFDTILLIVLTNSSASSLKLLFYIC
jgi:hypothetical protein